MPILKTINNVDISMYFHNMPKKYNGLLRRATTYPYNLKQIAYKPTNTLIFTLISYHPMWNEWRN